MNAEPDETRSDEKPSNPKRARTFMIGCGTAVFCISFVCLAIGGFLLNVGEGDAQTLESLKAATVVTLAQAPSAKGLVCVELAQVNVERLGKEARVLGFPCVVQYEQERIRRNKGFTWQTVGAVVFPTRFYLGDLAVKPGAKTTVLGATVLKEDGNRRHSGIRADEAVTVVGTVNDGIFECAVLGTQRRDDMASRLFPALEQAAGWLFVAVIPAVLLFIFCWLALGIRQGKIKFT
jgi:hypothetical protein